MQPPGGSGGFLGGPASVPLKPSGEGAFLWAASINQSALLCSRDGPRGRAGPHLPPGWVPLSRTQTAHLRVVATTSRLSGSSASLSESSLFLYPEGQSIQVSRNQGGG